MWPQACTWVLVLPIVSDAEDFSAVRTDVDDVFLQDAVLHLLDVVKLGLTMRAERKHIRRFNADFGHRHSSFIGTDFGRNAS